MAAKNQLVITVRAACIYYEAKKKQTRLSVGKYLHSASTLAFILVRNISREYVHIPMKCVTPQWSPKYCASSDYWSPENLSATVHTVKYSNMLQKNTEVFPWRETMLDAFTLWFLWVHTLWGACNRSPDNIRATAFHFLGFTRGLCAVVCCQSELKTSHALWTILLSRWPQRAVHGTLKTNWSWLYDRLPHSNNKETASLELL